MLRCKPAPEALVTHERYIDRRSDEPHPLFLEPQEATLVHGLETRSSEELTLRRLLFDPLSRRRIRTMDIEPRRRHRLEPLPADPLRPRMLEERREDDELGERGSCSRVDLRAVAPLLDVLPVSSVALAGVLAMVFGADPRRDPLTDASDTVEISCGALQDLRRHRGTPSTVHPSFPISATHNATLGPQ
jgi:hypothetical protein